MFVEPNTYVLLLCSKPVVDSDNLCDVKSPLIRLSDKMSRERLSHDPDP